LSAIANGKNAVFSPIDVQCILLPLVRPFLTRDIIEFNEVSILGFFF